MIFIILKWEAGLYLVQVLASAAIIYNSWLLTNFQLNESSTNKLANYLLLMLLHHQPSIIALDFHPAIILQYYYEYIRVIHTLGELIKRVVRSTITVHICQTRALDTVDTYIDIKFGEFQRAHA